MATGDGRLRDREDGWCGYGVGVWLRFGWGRASRGGLAARFGVSDEGNLVSGAAWRRRQEVRERGKRSEQDGGG